MDWAEYLPKLQPFLTKLTNYSHTAIGTVYAGIVLGYSLIVKKPLDPSLVEFSKWFYAFLLGHAAAYQKWPDKDGQ